MPVALGRRGAKVRATGGQCLSRRPRLLRRDLLAVPLETQVQEATKPLGKVVRLLLGEVHQRGPQADVEQPDDERVALLEGCEGEGGEGAGLRLGEQLDGRLGDDAHAAFGADDGADELGAAALPGERPGADDLPVAQDHLDGAHLLPHGSVPAGEVADAIGGDGTADGGDGQTPWVVAQDEALPPCACVQIVQDDAGLHPGHTVRAGDLDDAVHAAQVDRHAALERDDGTHDAGAASVRDDDHTGCRGRANDGGNLRGRLRPDLAATEPAAANGVEGQPLQGFVIREDGTRANGLLELAKEVRREQDQRS